MTLSLPVGDLSGTAAVLLVLAMGVAFAFEFVNGFHDTANAVATVIYTKSLAPRPAVVWSGVCNFLGVYLGGTAVAFSIVSLLPVDLLVSGKPGAGLAMVFAMLLAATSWNLGTWYLGLPASSSHTLVGAIVGVGLAHAALVGHSLGSGVNWPKLGEVVLSLLISPIIGFTCAAILLRVMNVFLKDPALYDAPPEDRPPPFWVRSTLVATCTGVSLAHGSNDGQKGIGLVMLILIGLLPAHYALNPTHRYDELARVISADDQLRAILDRHAPTAGREAIRAGLDDIRATLEGKSRLHDVPLGRRWNLRARLILVDRALEHLEENPPKSLGKADLARVKKARAALAGSVYYAPTWVLVGVATSLGLGTMIGWKRIVVTVGEKIGKAHLTYAQGASAEIVAVATIGLADFAGMPVSTTHVLSSGVAGTMAASRSGLQLSTVRNIALAWLFTLPASMALSAILYVLINPLLTRDAPTTPPASVQARPAGDPAFVFSVDPAA